MRQSLVRANDSSPHIFNPSPQSQPRLHALNFPTPKSMLSIPKQACKISHHDLTIRAPSSSLLILLGACCDVTFDAFCARADEGPPDVGNSRERRTRMQMSLGGMLFVQVGFTSEKTSALKLPRPTSSPSATLTVFSSDLALNSAELL